MANPNASPKLPKGKKDPFIEKFEVESDARLFRFLGVFLLLGAALVSYTLTVNVIIPGTLTYTEQKEDTAKVTLKTEDLEKLEKEKEKKKKEEEKKKSPPKKRRGAGGKPRGRGTPNAHATQAALKMITSRSTMSSLSAYKLFGKTITKDLDKVLASVSGLTKTGNTRLGGRRGKVDGGWNEGYAVGGSGGVDDLLGGLWGGDGSGGLNLQAKGGLKAPSSSDIDMGQESGQRSTESILRVIRQHTPGLRHTYNKYLKLNPGFKGKVTLKFTIAPSGSIIELSIISTTTGVVEFDQEVRDKVKSWHFEPVKGRANDNVTVPFTFSE